MKTVLKMMLLAVLTASVVFGGCKTNDQSELPPGGGKEPTEPKTAITLGKSSTTLTLYSSEQLTWTVTPVDAADKTVTCTGC